jgi:lipooligosaccharide transport system permease protein
MPTPLALRVVEANARVYRRTFRGSVISTFLTPMLTLLAMGVGLGSLIDEGPCGVPYLDWLGPGLLAAAAMQTGAGDSAWPVMAGIKWAKTYQATLSTPVGIPQLALGHLTWVGVRLIFVASVYVGTLILFGAVDAADGLLALIPAVLTGLATAAPVLAYAAWVKSDMSLTTLFRFGIVPLYLFSGTFFPVSRLPDGLALLAYVSPLWHGAELTRLAAGLGCPLSLPWPVHLGVLGVFIIGGTWASVAALRTRLMQ